MRSVPRGTWMPDRRSDWRRSCSAGCASWGTRSIWNLLRPWPPNGRESHPIFTLGTERTEFLKCCCQRDRPCWYNNAPKQPAWHLNFKTERQTDVKEQQYLAISMQHQVSYISILCV